MLLWSRRWTTRTSMLLSFIRVTRAPRERPVSVGALVLLQPSGSSLETMLRFTQTGAAFRQVSAHERSRHCACEEDQLANRASKFATQLCLCNAIERCRKMFRLRGRAA